MDLEELEQTLNALTKEFRVFRKADNKEHLNVEDLQSVIDHLQLAQGYLRRYRDDRKKQLKRLERAKKEMR
jgi:hypothetical protein